MNETDFISTLFQKKHSGVLNAPDKYVVQDFTNSMFELLSTSSKDIYNSVDELQKSYTEIRRKFHVIVLNTVGDEAATKRITDYFFNIIPSVYELLLKDAVAILEFDPAANSIEEIFLAYPGFFATAVYRIAHELYQLDLKIPARVIAEYAHTKTGIDIHPGALIGESFVIDHGTGVVIGETAVIGNNVKIYQGVTLGAINVSKQNSAVKRHPTIENNVVIYSGATILGGNTTIGHNSIIGGNVWLTDSIAPHSIVYHKSEITVRDKFELSEALNFVI